MNNYNVNIQRIWKQGTFHMQRFIFSTLGPFKNNHHQQVTQLANIYLHSNFSLMLFTFNNTVKLLTV